MDFGLGDISAKKADAMMDKDGTAERQQAAEATVDGFRKDLGPFVVAAETTRMPMNFTNAEVSGNPIIFVNQAFLNLTGYEEHEVLGQNFAFLIEPDTDPEALTEIQTAFEGGRGLDTQVRFRCKNGSVIWVAIFISTVRDENGNVVQHFASFIDVSLHKETESRLERRLKEANRLLQDTLATIIATAEKTLRDAGANERLDVFLDQISALPEAGRTLRDDP